MTSPLRITALISGGGRTVCNLQEWIEQGSLNAEIVLVVASRQTLPGIERARQAGLEVRIPDAEHYDDDLEQLVESSQPDVICLCGYLRHLRLRSNWHGRVINIHPALLPRHGGQGMYGNHVHESVLAAGDRVSGCTVHFVDDHYDHGPILLQRTCPVLKDDTASTLAKRVFQEECTALPEALELLGRDQVRLTEGRVEILPGFPPGPDSL